MDKKPVLAKGILKASYDKIPSSNAIHIKLDYTISSVNVYDEWYTLKTPVEARTLKIINKSFDLSLPVTNDEKYLIDVIIKIVDRGDNSNIIRLIIGGLTIAGGCATTAISLILEPPSAGLTTATVITGISSVSYGLYDIELTKASIKDTQRYIHDHAYLITKLETKYNDDL